MCIKMVFKSLKKGILTKEDVERLEECQYSMRDGSQAVVSLASKRISVKKGTDVKRDKNLIRRIIFMFDLSVSRLMSERLLSYLIDKKRYQRIPISIITAFYLIRSKLHLFVNTILHPYKGVRYLSAALKTYRMYKTVQIGW